MLFNKRITGWANVVLRRGRVHRREYLRAVLEEAAARADHVVVTGDITNMAHESEYREARRLLDEVARRVEVTVVPGNHDIYLPAVGRERRFPHHFAPFVASERASLAVTLPAGDYPLVKLRGPAAIVGLSSAVPRPPFVSGGVLGREQLAALERLLALPEVASRTPVLLVHHPPVDARSRVVRLRDGLIDADRLRTRRRSPPARAAPLRPRARKVARRAQDLVGDARRRLRERRRARPPRSADPGRLQPLRDRRGRGGGARRVVRPRRVGDGLLARADA